MCELGMCGLRKASGISKVKQLHELLVKGISAVGRWVDSLRNAGVSPFQATRLQKMPIDEELEKREENC